MSGLKGIGLMVGGFVGVVYSSAVVVTGREFIRSHRIMDDGGGFWLDGGEARLAGALGIVASLAVIVAGWFLSKSGEDRHW